MNTFLFLLKILVGKAIKDNLPDLNHKNLWCMLLNSNPLTVTVRITQVLISGLFFVVIDIGEDFGLPALAEPSIVDFLAKIFTCFAFTEVVYRIFSLFIEQVTQTRQ